MNSTISKFLYLLGTILIIFIGSLIIINYLGWYKLYICIIKQPNPLISTGSQGFNYILVGIGIFLSLSLFTTGYLVKRKGI